MNIMKVIITLFLIFALNSCNTKFDDEEMFSFERQHLGLSISQDEYVIRVRRLIKQYSNYLGTYQELLFNNDARVLFIKNSSQSNILGGYYLNACIEDGREVAIDLAKWLIDNGVNPYEPDYLAVNPAVKSAAFGRKEIFDYIIDKQKQNFYESVDIEFINQIITYNKYVESRK